MAASTMTAPRRALAMASGAAWAAAAAGAVVGVAWVGMQDFGPMALVLGLGAFAPLLVVARPEFGVLALTSTFFLSYPEALAGSGRFTINNLLGLLLAGALVIRIGVGRQLDFLRHRGVQLAALVGAVAAGSALLAGAEPPFAHLRELDLTDQRVHDIVTKTSFLLFVVAFIRARWQVVLLAAAIVVFVAFTAPNAVVNALSATAANVEKVRASADFGIVAARNANRLAFVCAIAIALVGCGMTAVRSRVARLLGGYLIALFVATVFLSASRSGLINLIVLAVFFAGRAGLRRGTLAALAFFLSFSLVSVAVLAPTWVGLEPDGPALVTPQPDRSHGSGLDVYLHRITSFLTESDEASGVAGSSRARRELLLVGLRMAADHPIAGIGIGNYRWVSVLDYGNRHLSALHNSYVLTLVEGGLLLFIPYVLLFGWTWRELAATRRRAAAGGGAGLGWLVDATRAILVVFLVFSFFADLWHDVYLYLIVGLSAVLARLHAEGEATA